MEHVTRARFGNKHMLPFDIVPQVKQQQGQSNQEQSQRHTFGGGSCSHGVHQTVTGFDPKTSPIFFKELLGGKVQLSNDGIGETFDTVAAIPSLVVFTDNMNGQSTLAILLTGTSIDGSIALSSLQQRTRAALFTPDSQWDDAWEGLAAQILYDGIVVKTSIQKQPFYAQSVNSRYAQSVSN